MSQLNKDWYGPLDGYLVGSELGFANGIFLGDAERILRRCELGVMVGDVLGTELGHALGTTTGLRLE